MSEYHPDEPWQSEEAAYRLAYGEGTLTWEWRDDARIRPVSVVLLIGALYRLLSFLSFDSPFLVSFFPRLVHSALVAAGDLAWKRTLEQYQPQSANLAFFAHLCCWYYNYAIVRTYSNSIEAALWLLAWRAWPWKNNNNIPIKTIVIAAMAVNLRPTGAVLLLYLFVAHVRGLAAAGRPVVRTLANAAMAIACVSGVSVLVDSIFYGAPTLTAVNFLLVNIFHGVSSYYGVNSFHWLLSDALPTILGPALPAFAWACTDKHTWKSPFMHLFMIYGLLFSLGPHKEVRFLLPVVPLLSAPIGRALERMRKRWKNKFPAIIYSFTGANIVLLVFFSTIYQAAPSRAISFTRRHALSSIPTSSRVPHVLFLTRCHATPMHTKFHDPARPSAWRLEYLDCSPGVVNVQRVFDRQPLLFMAAYAADSGPLIQTWNTTKVNEWERKLRTIETQMDELSSLYFSSSSSCLPDYIYLCPPLVVALQPWLSHWRYRTLARFGHTLDRQEDFIVMARERESTQTCVGDP